MLAEPFLHASSSLPFSDVTPPFGQSVTVSDLRAVVSEKIGLHILIVFAAMLGTTDVLSGMWSVTLLPVDSHLSFLSFTLFCYCFRMSRRVAFMSEETQ